jgi:hypothetical protein
LLLSPAGVPEKPEDFDNQEIVDRFETKKGKLGAKIALHLWENNYTPFGILRKGGVLASKAFLNFYVGRRMTSIRD